MGPMNRFLMGWGKFMNGGHKRRRKEGRLILNLDLSKNNPPTSP